MGYHVETSRFGFKKLPERILVREDGAYGDNKEHGKPITDYWYVLERQTFQSENIKLRELVRDMWSDFHRDYMCSWEGSCKDPLCEYNGECSYENRMYELGIEVDEC